MEKKIKKENQNEKENKKKLSPLLSALTLLVILELKAEPQYQIRNMPERENHL